MTEPIWRTRAGIEAIHQDQLHRHGGHFGVRDDPMLESALAGPRQTLADEEPVDVAALAAAYGVGIAPNHPFVDGTPRTALMASYAFLRVNGVRLMASEPEVVTVMLGVAAGEPELAAWCRQRGEGISE